MFDANLGRAAPERTWTIGYIVEGEHVGEFYLLAPDQFVRDYGDKPRLLAKRAWAEGADAVIHDYDLNLDPEA